MKNRTTAAIALLAWLLLTPTAVAADGPLFPAPLHLTREIDDPISGQTFVVDEYYEGNRHMSVSGDRVAISDYAAGTLTEIDRAAGTYSVTPFEVLATAKAGLSGSAGRAPEVEAALRAEPMAPQKLAGRVAETFGVKFEEGELRRVEMSFDPDIVLSREALDIVVGAAWPNEPSLASRATREMGRRRVDRTVSTAKGSPAAQYRLPLRQLLEFEIAGERLTVENRTVRISDEGPPAELLTIPPDATRIEHHLIKTQRMLEELDRLPGSKGRDR